jgi:hypothetical protein
MFPPGSGTGAFRGSIKNPMWHKHSALYRFALTVLLIEAGSGVTRVVVDYPSGEATAIETVPSIERSHWQLHGRSTLLHERVGSLADFLKRHFEVTKFLRAQFREHSLHLPGMLSEGWNN